MKWLYISLIAIWLFSCGFVIGRSVTRHELLPLHATYVPGIVVKDGSMSTDHISYTKNSDGSHTMGIKPPDPLDAAVEKRIVECERRELCYKVEYLAENSCKSPNGVVYKYEICKRSDEPLPQVQYFLLQVQ